MQSELSVLVTEFQALAAVLLGPVANAVAGLLRQANLASTSARFLQEGGENAERLRSVARSVIADGGSADDVNRAQQEEAGRILLEQRREAINLAAAESLERSRAIPILENEARILEINGDLTDQRVFNLEKANIELEFSAKLEKDGLTELQKKVLQQEKLNKLKKTLGIFLD